MKKKRFTEEQIVRVLKEHQDGLLIAGPLPTNKKKDACKKILNELYSS